MPVTRNRIKETSTKLLETYTPLQVPKKIEPTQPTPQWKTWKIKAFAKAADKIETAQTGLQVVFKIIKVARSFLSIIQVIANFISIFERLLSFTIMDFISLLIEPLKRMLRDIEKTGVYFLDLTSYHWEQSADEFYNDKDYAYEREAAAGTEWSEEEATGTGYMKEKDSKTSRDELGKMTLEEQAKAEFGVGNFDIGFGDDEEGLSLRDINFNFNYKKESYNEFIDVVAGCFLNEKDVAGAWVTQMGILSTISLGNSDSPDSESSGVENMGQPDAYVPDGYPDLSNINVVMTEQKEDNMPSAVPFFENIRSGRPDFGPNSTMNAHLFVLAFTDIFELIDLVRELLKLGLDLVKIPEIKSKMQFDLPEFAEKDPTGKTGGELYTKKPYFYGITVGQIFPTLFTNLNDLIKRLEKLYIKNKEEDKDSIMDKIQEVLDDITAFLDDLEEMLRMINKMMNVIKAFLRLLGISHLAISTNQGTSGIVEQLYNASGFRDMAVEAPEDFQEATHAITEKENEVHFYMNTKNFIDSKIKKVSQKITDQGIYFGWKPSGFLYTSDSYEFPDSYSTTLQDLFLELWDFESNPNYEDGLKDPGLVEVQAILVILEQELIVLQDNLTSMTPEGKEQLIRNKAQSEIDALQAEVDGANDAQARYDLIITNLGTIKQAVIDWEMYNNGNPAVSGDTGQDLDTKQEALAELAILSAAEQVFQDDIDELNDEGKDIYSDGTNDLSLNLLKDYLTEIETEYDRYNNGWDLDGDGSWETIPIDTQIASVQTEIDEMDAQQADATSLDVENYEDERAELVIQKAAIETLKTDTNDDYDVQINTITDIIDDIEALDSFDYQSELDYARTNVGYLFNAWPMGLAELKDERNEAVVDSPAYDYSTLIAEKEQELEDINEEYTNIGPNIIDATNAFYTSAAVITTAGYEASDYPSGSEFPGITGVVAWPPRHIEIEAQVHDVRVTGDWDYEPMLVTAKVEQAVVGPRSSIIDGEQSLFDTRTYGMWYYEDILRQYELRKYQLEGEVFSVPARIEELTTEYDAWKEDNMLLQEIQAYKINALVIQMELDDLEDQLDAAGVARVASYNAAQTIITPIETAGRDDYLSVQDSYYFVNQNLEDEKDSYEWDVNETRWLEKYRDWDKTNPDFKRDATEITVPKVDGAIDHFTKAKATFDTRLEFRQEELGHLQDEEDKRRAKVNKQWKRDLQRKEIQELSAWSPDTKMYFMGFLIAWGYPNLANPTYYQNFADAVTTTYNNPDGAFQQSLDMVDQFKSAKGDTKKNFSKIFKE